MYTYMYSYSSLYLHLMYQGPLGYHSCIRGRHFVKFRYASPASLHAYVRHIDNIYLHLMYQGPIGYRTYTPLFMCFIDLTEAYDSVDPSLLWTLSVRFGTAPIMLAVIHQFYDGMRACVRLGDGMCSDMFDVEQGLRQGCVLVPLLFTVFLRRCCAWWRNASPLIQSSWKAWSNSNERRIREKRGGGYGPEEPTDRGRRRRPRLRGE